LAPCTRAEAVDGRSAAAAATEAVVEERNERRLSRDMGQILTPKGQLPTPNENTERTPRRGRANRHRHSAIYNAFMEAWLRGPVEGVAPVLQPVAHMLLHAREDASAALDGLGPAEIWARPGGGASIGFHVRHLMGALDRLFTYARGEALGDAQMACLKGEIDPGDPPADAARLTRELGEAIDRALAQVRSTSETTLLDPRGVGRRHAPSTVLGLLVHGGEHSARHAGQAITLKRIVSVP